MTTQKCLLLIGCLLYAITSFGQSKPKIHEVGVTINPKLNFSLFYKAGGPNSLFRVRTLFLSGFSSSNPMTGTTIGASGIGVRLGAEFRKNIIDDLYFVYGFDVGFSYRGSSNVKPQTNQSLFVVAPSMNFVLGVGYVLKERWVFSVELLPYISYEVGMQQENFQFRSESTTFRYGLDLSGVSVGVAYRFYKKETN